MERIAAQVVAVKKRDMRRIDAALHRLQVVAFLRALGHEAMRMRHLCPFEGRQRRLELRRPHIDPDDVAQLDAGIGRQLDLPAEPARLGLGGDLGALSADVVFPAMIGAAQPVLLVASEPERHAAVGAEFVDHADAPLRVAECQQPLGKKFDAHRRAVRLRHFVRQQRWNPIAPEQVAHRRARPGLGQKIVVLARGHGIGSLARRAFVRPASFAGQLTGGW